MFAKDAKSAMVGIRSPLYQLPVTQEITQVYTLVFINWPF